MDSFVAVILVCLNSTPADQCSEKTAADVMSTIVNSELDCTRGWQEVVGRSALHDEIGKTAYVKTLCRRDSPPPAPDAAGGRQ